MAQTSELTPEEYHHQHSELPSVGNNYEETLGYALGNVAVDSYYNSCNSSSAVFNVSSRFNQVYPSHQCTTHHLLNTQSQDPSQHQYPNQLTPHQTQQQYYNTQPAAYYGWVSSVPLGGGNHQGNGNSSNSITGHQSNHFLSPMGHTHSVYNPHHQSIVSSTGLPLYNHSQYTTTTTGGHPNQPSVTIQHHAAAATATLSPNQPTAAISSPGLSSIPSTTWNTSTSTTGGYPFTTDNTTATDQSDHFSYSSILPQAMGNTDNGMSYSLSLRDDSPNSSTGIDGPLGLINEDESRPLQSGNQEKRSREKMEAEEEDDQESYHSSPTNNDGENEPKKPKRTRTAFTTHQLDQLEICFSNSSYPDAFTRDEIAKHLSIKEDRIQVWFQNRRARQRKQERTGSVSIRSRSRQQRVQRIKESQVYYGYSQPNLARTNRIMSPRAPQSIPQFSFQSVSAVHTTESMTTPYQFNSIPTTNSTLSHLPLLSTATGMEGNHHSSPTSINSDHN